MTHADDVCIASDALEARISLCGAELQSLRTARGVDLQWDGDPAVWSGRAPILFPIVGALVDGRYRVDGRSYAMEKHGFAHHSTFQVVAHEAGETTLRLQDDAATRAHYPFAFRLDLTFSLAGPTLTLAAVISNPDDTALPASLGFHPAFRWPLPFGRPRADHRLRFQRDEPAPVRRIDGAGLLTPEAQPTPVEGRTLQLRDALFEDDALLFDRIASRSLLYGAPEGPQLEPALRGLPAVRHLDQARRGLHRATSPAPAAPTRKGLPATCARSPASSRCFPARAGGWPMHVTLVDGET